MTPWPESAGQDVKFQQRQSKEDEGPVETAMQEGADDLAHLSPLLMAVASRNALDTIKILKSDLDDFSPSPGVMMASVRARASASTILERARVSVCSCRSAGGRAALRGRT